MLSIADKTKRNSRPRAGCGERYVECNQYKETQMQRMGN
jgi:hypothetical protein